MRLNNRAHRDTENIAQTIALVTVLMVCLWYCIFMSFDSTTDLPALWDAGSRLGGEIMQSCSSNWKVLYRVYVSLPMVLIMGADGFGPRRNILFPTISFKVKVKWSRYRPGVAQRVGRGIALLFNDRGTRRGWVVSSTPRPHFTPRERPGTHFTTGWVGPRAGLDGRKISSPPWLDPGPSSP